MNSQGHIKQIHINLFNKWYPTKEDQHSYHHNNIEDGSSTTNR